MSRLLYLDCFSGISGDMTLGALLDAGLPLPDLRAALGSLALGGAHVHAHKVQRAGIAATKFTVHEHEHSHDHSHDHRHDHSHGHAHDHGAAAHAHDHPHRTLEEIFALIDRSALSPQGRLRARAMFERLARVEASIHDMPLEQVHLHEVGALDSIVDIVGAVFAMEWVGADEIVCSPLNVGGGMVRSAHGLLPVPAPATVKLLGDAPVYAGAVQHELVTPTGALIATTYARSFGPIPSMSIERVGYGAGDRDSPETPNVLRVLVGRKAAPAELSSDRASERVSVIECEIDDMNPQIFGVLMDRLYEGGALEVFYSAVQMKKNRPGTLVTVVARPESRERLTAVIFRETTTIGLRHDEVSRECLKREWQTVQTPVGAVRFKIAWRDGAVINASPEFDDCARLAAAAGLSVKEVQAMAVSAYAAAGKSNRA